MFLCREFLKQTDYLHDDIQDFSHEYAHDYFEDEDIKTQNVKIGQKRNYPHKIVSQDIYNCATVVRFLVQESHFLSRS